MREIDDLYSEPSGHQATRIAVTYPLTFLVAKAALEAYHAPDMAVPKPGVSAEHAMTQTSASGVPFGALLKQFREAAGLTQEALAEQAGLSVRAISALERGVNRTPRRDTLERLASALALPVRKRAQLAAAAHPEIDPALAQPAGLDLHPKLPLPATPLLGREHEVDAVIALLRQRDTRLVTLTGPGGVGKTRLALQVIEDVGGSFDDGVIYAELADVRDSDDVATAIGQAMSLREAPGYAIVDRLMGYVHGKDLLVALDNFEHVSAAAPLIAQLLGAAPRLKVLVTSRSSLRLRAEHEFAVPPLPVPEVGRGGGVADVGQVRESAAVQLFVQRARAAGSPVVLEGPTTLAVLEICRRLDGLPLALELAAARTKLLPPLALLERLGTRLPLLVGGARDLPARQRTMREAIGWSYELLGATEREVFRQLAVCVGGCTLDVAEKVVGRGTRSALDELLDSLAVLTDHSLLQAREDATGEPRLTMLEVVREYGLEQLTASGDAAATHERHARVFLQLAEEANPHLMGSPQQSAWLDRLEREHGNLLAALRWAWEGGHHEIGLRAVGAIGPFWYFRGYFSLGRAWMDRFLASTAQVEGARPHRLWLLYGVAKLALEQGDYARVRTAATEARTLAEALGNTLGMAQALEMQGLATRLQGDALGGRALLEQALLWSRRAGDPGQLGRVLFALGDAAREVGDASRAEAAFEELVTDSSEFRPAHGVARVLSSLAEVVRERGDFQRASALFGQAVCVYQTIRDPNGFATCFEGLAAVARDRGDMERSARLGGAAAGLRESVASILTPAARRSVEGTVAAARQTLGDDAFAAEWAAGRALPLDEVVAYALAGAEAERA
jgi:predicted ATPase/transcriptional regulator with XRE-family HTH domain